MSDGEAESDGEEWTPSDGEAESDGEEWMPGLVNVNADEGLDAEEEHGEVATHRSSRTKKQVNYCGENHDEFFDDSPGYTNFGRTKKRGDRRPRAKQNDVSSMSFDVCVPIYYLFII